MSSYSKDPPILSSPTPSSSLPSHSPVPQQSSAIHIRPALPSDLPSLHAIYAAYVLGSIATFDLVVPSLSTFVSPSSTLGGLLYSPTFSRCFHVAVVPRPSTSTSSEEAATEEDLVGYAYASPYRARPAYDHTVELSIYVHPHHHRLGIGSLLVRRVLEGCRDVGKMEVVAVVAVESDGTRVGADGDGEGREEGNGRRETGRTGGEEREGQASVRMHEKLGFRLVGRLVRVGYKLDKWCDTVIFQKSLLP